MARASLTRDSIVACAAALVAEGGELSLRKLGAVLGADPTAVYRHFRDKDELTRAVGDLILGPVVEQLPSGRSSWRTVVVEVCVRLRAALLAHPTLSAYVRAEPTRQPNELAITEVLLTQFRRAGLDAGGAAAAYHSVISLTVGTATIDASVADRPDLQRSELYREWRATYAALDPAAFPRSVEAAGHLWLGTADERFRFALEALLNGLVPKRTAR